MSNPTLVKGEFIDKVLNHIEKLPIGTMEYWLNNPKQFEKILKEIFFVELLLEGFTPSSFLNDVNKAIREENSKFCSCMSSEETIIYPFEEESEFPIGVFPIWRSLDLEKKFESEEQIEIELKKASVLVSSMVGLGNFTEIITSVSYGHTDQKISKKIDLIKITPLQIGFTKQVSWQDFYYRANKYGLSLCPEKTVLYLSLENIKQSEGDFLYIGADSYNDTKLFCMHRIFKDIKIISVFNSKYLFDNHVLFNLNDVFVFTSKN